MDVKVSDPGVAPFARAILVYCRERKSGISRIHKDRVTKTAHPLLALYPETTNPCLYSKGKKKRPSSNVKARERALCISGHGAACENRTRDLLITSEMLYRLS